MNLYLIRHGRTEANERHLYCGSTDLPLSDSGRAELRLRHYTVPENTVFLSSGMRRCNETLRILFGSVPYKVEPAFREIDFGIFEMKGYDELKALPAYQTWITGNNHANIPPNGESGAQMTRRVIVAFEKIKKNEVDTVIVTHGGVIAALMMHLFPQEDKNLYQWQPAPGCGYRIDGNCYKTLK